jgi:hypothetical protein
VATAAGLAVLATRRGPQPVASLPSTRAEPAPRQPLAVRSLRLTHFRPRGDVDEVQGEIGGASFGTRYGDKVRVKAELSEPAYCYLLALNPNGKVQLCWPEDGTMPPEKQRELTYPTAPGLAFTLNDEPRGGLQAFVLVAARQPLPAYTEWRPRLPALPWERVPAAAVVWQGDDQGIDPVLPGGGNRRGTVEEIKGLAPLAATVRRLRSAPGVETVWVVAFAVTPDTGR